MIFKKENYVISKFAPRLELKHRMAASMTKFSQSRAGHAVLSKKFKNSHLM